MLNRAIRQGWPIGQDTRDRVVPILERLAFDGGTDDRTRLKAIECIRAMCRDNVTDAVELDRIERLESGNATERIEFAPMKF